MAIENPENWFLKKHESGEIFGPIPFRRIVDWASAAQVNSQDMVSNDKTVWTQAPMIPELKMDWLVVLGEDLLYGPTTAGSLMEFFRAQEIHEDTRVINCCTGHSSHLKDTLFFKEAPPEMPEPVTEDISPLDRIPSPVRGDLRLHLQQRVRELEKTLLDKQRRLTEAEEAIARLESRIKELEERVHDVSSTRVIR